MDEAPPCVCPVIGVYATRLNDVLPLAPRQRLREYLLLLPGTVELGSESARACALIRHLSGVMLPLAMRASGFTEAADLLAADFAHGVAPAEAIAIALDSGWDGHAVPQLTRAARFAMGEPHRSASHAAIAMAVLLEQLEEADHDPAIAALDAMLAIGRQAAPPDAAKVGAAIEAFAAARRKAGADRGWFNRARLAALSGAAA